MDERTSVTGVQLSAKCASSAKKRTTLPLSAEVSRQLTAEEDRTPLMTMTVEEPDDTTVVNNVRPTCDRKGIFTTLHVAGRPIRFQVNTSAACNVISRRNIELSRYTHMLRPTNHIL